MQDVIEPSRAQMNDLIQLQNEYFRIRAERSLANGPKGHSSELGKGHSSELEGHFSSQAPPQKVPPEKSHGGAKQPPTPALTPNP